MLVVAALISALFISSFVPAPANETGWVLTQKSQTFGDQYLYVSPSGFKCVNPKAGIAFVTRAPNWDVVMFNDRTRVYFATTFDQWKRQIASRFNNERKQAMANCNWARGQAGNIAGLRATQFVMHGTNKGLQRIANKRSQHLSQVNSADYWVSEDIKVPPRLAELLADIYGLPPSTSVPLRLTYTVEGGGGRRVLDTYRCQSCPIPVTYYNSPTGYAAVKSEVEVMADEETKQMIDDMARDLDSKPSGGGSKPITNQDLDKFLDAFKKRK